MPSTKQQVQDIIRAASFACSEIDAEAQEAGPGPEAIASIQTGMIIAIASVHGIKMDNAAAADLLHTLASHMQGGQLPVSRQALAGWLPGIDNGINGSKATAVTEAIGWTANSHFDQVEAKTKSW